LGFDGGGDDGGGSAPEIYGEGGRGFVWRGFGKGDVEGRGWGLERADRMDGWSLEFENAEGYTCTDERTVKGFGVLRNNIKLMRRGYGHVPPSSVYTWESARVCTGSVQSLV